MCKHILKIGLFIILLSLFSASFAEAISVPNASSQPLTINAEHSEFFKNNLLGNFYGNVQVTQGTSLLQSDKLRVQLDTKRQLQQVTAWGSPAKYYNHDDAKQPPLFASADKIIYQQSKQQIILTGHAQVTQGNNSLHGPKIIYDVAKKTIVTAAVPGQRTTIILEANNHDKLMQNHLFE